MATVDKQALADFGSLVRKSREALGVTQQEASDVLEISRSYYTHIENGSKNVPILLAIKICNYYKIDFNEFTRKYL